MELTLPPRVTDRAFARLAEIAEMTGEQKALRVAERLEGRHLDEVHDR